MTRSMRISLSLLSGFLLVPAWSEFGSGLFLLFALIPLLYVEDYLYQNRARFPARKVFGYAYLSFLVWNAGTSLWLLNSTWFALIVVFGNPLRVAVIIWLFHVTRRNTNTIIGYISLVVYWIAGEHFHMICEFNHPWLTLGNGFANDVYLVQWYEFTGVYGGTLWVLLSNIFGFRLLKYYESKRFKGIMSVAMSWIGVFLIPMIISLTIFLSYTEKDDPKEFVIVQPNIDPYEEKFGGMSMDTQMDILLHLADSLITPETEYIITPETFVNDSIWSGDIYTNPYTQRVYNHLKNKCPQATVILGLHYQKRFSSNTGIEGSAVKIPGTEDYYLRYNAAIQVDTTMLPQVYNKSQLTVVVEKVPYSKYLGFLKKHLINLGGITRNLGTQDHRSNLYSQFDGTGISPVICYESIFGEFVTDYIREGSDFICVITNDGWWGDTQGYKQHHAYSRLRAIENRRSVARSANNGISSFINQKGQIIQRTEYWEKAALRGNINRNDKLTFYSKHGDFIARISYVLSLVCFLFFVPRIIQRLK